MLRNLKERSIQGIFLIMALTSILFLAGIVLVLIREGLGVFEVTSLGNFLFGRRWSPTYEPPDFGILPLILGSLMVTFGALVVAVPLGLLSALYLAEVAPHRAREVLKPAVELLASIPSVVYGFFGLVVFASWVQSIFKVPTGLTALTASVILGIMALPTVTSIAEDALNAVPSAYREASCALGATRWETMTRVVLPAAGSGVSTAVILGMGRAIGETMTVLIVAGGSPVIPRSFLRPVRPLTATIAAEMGEAVVGSPHHHALFAIGLVLFVITLGFNLLADQMAERYRRQLRQ